MITGRTPSDVWREMLEGNERFVSGTPLHPRQDVERRFEVLAKELADERRARELVEKRLLKLQGQLGSVRLLIVDELGYVPLSQIGAELLFEVFSQRYERGATSAARRW